jgi:3-phenylpropionate/trans-cinnamate dioxygenase ferredoxin reductase subunit
MCGGRAAEALRREGFDGRVVLIGAEREPPYERPPLSKEYMRGELEREKLYLLPRDWYSENGVDLLLGRKAERLDASRHVVELDDGARIQFDRLLLATGGRVRRLEVPGADLEGIYYLRDIDDSERIGAQLREGCHVVVVGAGFIGSEVAASCRLKGLEVTVLEVEEAPLQRTLGPELGKVFAAIHRDKGVNLRTGVGAKRFEGTNRVQAVVTTADERIQCDFVVVGVGIAPNVELAMESGIETQNGIVVDEHCRTSVEGVFAAGDVANHFNPVLGERLRVEHEQNAQRQGAVAALNMLGRDEPYLEVPWFWSDQYEYSMQYAGHATRWDEIVLRGSLEERKFTAFYLSEGRLRAALAINSFRDVRFAREIIKRGGSVDPARLKDPGTDLRSLIPA